MAEDEPGVVRGAFSAIGDVNIALAESITTNEGLNHASTMICELKEQQNLKTTCAKIRKQLAHRRFKDISLAQFHPEQNVVWEDIGIVKRGWLDQTKWRDEFAARYAKLADSCGIDLNRVVVTFDTNTRAMRFVFPRKGAINISIEHADRPGALDSITGALFKANLNLLSAILRRGGAKPGNAVLMATAEPKDGANTVNMEKLVRDALNEVPVKFRPIAHVHAGRDAASVIWAADPDTLVAPCPSVLMQTVVELRERIPKGKIPVFFSRRFTDESRGAAIAECVRKAASENGCVLLESDPPQGDAPVTVFNEVCAKMWTAEAGIVLVLGSHEGGGDPLGVNLPHECGYLQGQSKATMLLVEGGGPDALRRWSNVHGIHAPRFAEGNEAFNPSHPRNLNRVVSEWILAFKERRLRR